MILDAYGTPATYGWTVPKKIEGIPHKAQLPQSDWDVLAQLYERTDREIAQQRWPGQEDFQNAEKRMGKTMFTSELVAKVTKLNRDLVCEDSLAQKDCAAFYLVNNTGKHYTNASFRKGVIPEFTIMGTDRADLPTRDGFRPGWRTVLQRLVQFKALTYRQMLAVFGEVHYGDLRGRNWNNAVSGFRH